jgi:hypothetical protein
MDENEYNNIITSMKIPEDDGTLEDNAMITCVVCQCDVSL